jgi:hypothetical protein
MFNRGLNETEFTTYRDSLLSARIEIYWGAKIGVGLNTFFTSQFEAVRHKTF